MKKRLGWTPLVLVGTLALIGGFWWLDFQAVQSETQTTSTMSTHTSGLSKNGVRQHQLALTVIGDNALSLKLQHELLQQLAASPDFSRVMLADYPEQHQDVPLLVVEVSDCHILWTPVYAHSHVTLAITYSTDGDISWNQDRSPTTVFEAPGIRINGEIHVDDTTQGLISRTAYEKHLGQQSVIRVLESLQDGMSKSDV